MWNRRTFLAAAAAPLFGKPDSRVKGVLMGAQSYSFRDRPLDEAIKAIAACGLSYVELWSGHVKPPDTAKEIRRKFGKAGIRVYAYSFNIRKENSDKEIADVLQMTKEFGTKYLTTSSTVDQAKRLNDLAAKAGVLIAVHNHSNVKNPNEFATVESFAKAMEGNPNIRINLDIGHFVAANNDPVAYLKQHHDRIVTLHIKDRKRDQGPNVPFGQGDTPIKEVLTTLRDNHWQIPAMIEYEYKGGDAVEEVRKSYDYMKQALA